MPCTTPGIASSRRRRSGGYRLVAGAARAAAPSALRAKAASSLTETLAAYWAKARFEDMPEVMARLAAGTLPAVCHTIIYGDR